MYNPSDNADMSNDKGIIDPSPKAYGIALMQRPLSLLPSKNTVEIN